MSQIENVSVSMRIPFVDYENGRELLRKIQQLPFPQTEGQPCGEMTIVITNSWSLPCYVTAVTTKYTHNFDAKYTELGKPLYADVTVELTPVVYSS